MRVRFSHAVPTMLAALSFFGTGLMSCGFGGAGLYFAYDQHHLRSASNDQPQTIRCRDLMDHGPGDNAYVIVTECKLLGNDFVVQHRDEIVKTEPWDKAWIPMTPTGEDVHYERLTVILESTKVTTRSQLEALAKQGQVRGMVVGDVSRLGAKQERLLRRAYPLVDFKKCVIIQHEATREGTLGGMLCGGVCGSVLTLLGLILCTNAGLRLFAVRKQDPGLA